MISFKRFLEEGVHSDFAKSLSHEDLFKHLETHADPNDKASDHWADRKAAILKELHKRHSSKEEGFHSLGKEYVKNSGHDHSILDRFLSHHADSPSPYVKRTAESLLAKIGKPVIPQQKPKQEKPAPKEKVKKEVETKLDTSIHPEGKLESEKGDTSEHGGSSEVTHIFHKTQDGKRKKVATVVSTEDSHTPHIVKNGKLSPIETPFKHKTHKEAVLRAIKTVRDTQ
jgi:hypothetical protein